MVPFSLSDIFWKDFNFWIGLVFVTFPLNYLVYGLNDYNDIVADKMNKRKGNYLFGAQAPKDHLAKVPLKIVIILLPFLSYFIFTSGIYMAVLLVVMIVFNILYNFSPFRLKQRPPFEIIIQIGYILTAVFSVLLNNLEALPWQTLLYLTLFAFQAHIAGEIMDIEPDVRANKKTTATILGRKKSKYLMLSILMLEVYILYAWFQDYFLASFLGLFSIWLVLDIFIFFKGKPYTLLQMKVFGFCMNIVALVTMGWALYSENLLNPVF